MADKLPNHKLPVLADIRVAAPCKASWTEMAGDGRSRFCGECKTQVFNLSEMTRDQAERLIIERNGDLCARYYQRADGTVLTKNCEEGVHRRKRNAVAAYAGIAALFIGGGAMGARHVAAQGPDEDQLRALDIQGNADDVTIENPADVQTEHDDRPPQVVPDIQIAVPEIDHEIIMGKISSFNDDNPLDGVDHAKAKLEQLKLEKLHLEEQLKQQKLDLE